MAMTAPEIRALVELAQCVSQTPPWELGAVVIEDLAAGAVRACEELLMTRRLVVAMGQATDD